MGLNERYRYFLKVGITILYLSAIKYKNDPGSLAIKAFKIAIKGKN